jgi:hypothetical protein
LPTAAPADIAQAMDPARNLASNILSTGGAVTLVGLTVARVRSL